jgi:HAE1 family hydrophobic/amphiphilic exporter-1
MIQISADRGALSFGEAVGKMERAFDGVDFPKDYFYRFGDNFERMQRNNHEVSLALLLMLVLMYLVLASLFESYTQPLLLMASVPMAFVGSVAVLVLFGKSVNVGVLMGFLFLGGISVNNAIVLVDSINRLAAEGVPIMTRVVKGACGRLRPVLITSCTTVLGMLPLALDRSEDAALWAPLALTVIGGMFSSTVLTLVAMPLIYLLAADARRIFPVKNS